VHETQEASFSVRLSKGENIECYKNVPIAGIAIWEFLQTKSFLVPIPGAENMGRLLWRGSIRSHVLLNQAPFRDARQQTFHCKKFTYMIDSQKTTSLDLDAQPKFRATGEKNCQNIARNVDKTLSTTGLLELSSRIVQIKWKRDDLCYSCPLQIYVVTSNHRGSTRARKISNSLLLTYHWVLLNNHFQKNFTKSYGSQGLRHTMAEVF
jgi:hypothetical protein